MIICIENGRLGNQLFQYNFISNIKKNKEKVFLIGFKSLKKIIKSEHFIFINIFVITDLIIKYRYLILRILKNKKITNIIYEDKKKIFKNQNGYLSNLTFIDGFFQSSIELSKKNFDNINQSKKNYVNYFFVHVRLSDFAIWPSKKFPAILPIEWYIKCIIQILKKNKKAKFFLFSDEPQKLKNSKLTKYCKIQSLNEIETFYFMMRCEGGILSASTYSWFASYLSYSINKNKGPFFAPKFWAGFRMKTFYPRGLEKTKFLKFVSVNF
jgi:hypothetical protein